MSSGNRWVLAATVLGSSMTFVDATVVNVALPALQADLHATITEVQWVIEAYALFLGALILTGGALGDQFGRKRVFLGGVVFFTLASILCGAATSTRALIVARALQGIGAAFLVPGSLAIISATFDDARRGKAIGTWSGFSAITAASGPVIGGWLIEHVSWRAVFFLNVPLAAIIVALSLWFMEESRDESRATRVDWSGAALVAIGLGAVIFGLLQWPVAGGTDRLVLGALAAGSLMLLLFIAVERRVGNPMLPLTLFRSRAFTLANVVTLLLYAPLAVVFFLVPMNLIQVRGYSATAAGSALLPFPIIIFALSRWSGGLVARIGSRLPLTIGPAVAACGIALFAWPDGASYWSGFFPASVVLGAGMAVTVAPLTTTVMDAVERQHAGVASGINNAVARVAGLLAVAVFGVVLVETFDARTMADLDDLSLPAGVRTAIDRELPKMAGADVERATAMDPSTAAAVSRVIANGFVSAFRVVMIAAAAVAMFAAMLVFALFRDRSRGDSSA